MKLKERKPYLVMERMRQILLDSEVDIGVNFPTAVSFYGALTKEGFDREECIYTVRLLINKGYLNAVDDEYSAVKLTLKGYEEWIFPNGHEIPNKIFLSHSSLDKKFAGEVKKLLEPDFSVFVAHADIEGAAKWRDRILSEMKSSGLFLALRTENFKGAQYTEQECGFALAMGKRILCICINTEMDKMGFCGEYQGVFFKEENSEEIAAYCRKQFLQ